jgi:hypothetical protein
MSELKPFHKSVIVALEESLKKFSTYRRPTGDLSNQPVMLLKRDLMPIVNLIKITKVPESEISVLLANLEDFFRKVARGAKEAGYSYKDIQFIDEMFSSLLSNLEARMK